jgi:glutamine amidotransferase
MRVAVIDHGTGNLGSMLGALGAVGARATLATQPDALRGAERVILPGVGSFTDGMGALRRAGWVEAIRGCVREGTPLLGVCIGMQLLATAGMEGATEPAGTEGLGLIGGTVRHLRDSGCRARLPHVGWNELRLARPDDPMVRGIPEGTQFYFVHSYGFAVDDADHVVATTHHGVEVVAAVRSDRVWGTQFHPEKSGRAGFAILRNFLSEGAC